MSKNLAFRPGGQLSLPVPAGTESGDPVKVGGLIGVATTPRGGGVGNLPTHASIDISGLNVYEFDVDGSISGVGTPIYITSGADLTVTSTSNTLFGHTVAAADGKYATKSSGVGKALVKPVTV